MRASWDAGNDDVEPLARSCIDQRAGGRGHDHARDAADRHDSANQTALPIMREQVHAEERSNARLHVRHEEIQRLQRP